MFLNAAEKYQFDDGLQAQIDYDLEEIANKLNKRFTFDEASLIHLIEASKGSNIITEEDFLRISKSGRRQMLKQKDDGTYYLVDTTPGKGLDTYTTGKNIPTGTFNRGSKRITSTIRDEDKNIELSSYPGAKELIGTKSKSEIMQEVMKNLFANLELCVDTYKFYYTKDNDVPLEKSISVKNTAILADDSQFDFYYKINSHNLPHLLGIQRGITLSDTTKKYFAEVGKDGTVKYPINENSSAFEILAALLKNKERIIDDGGLVEENGKLYQLFPWEKIILKTSSFMRGDFFKTCFCLVQLERGLIKNNEKYVFIAPTKYDESMIDNKFDAKKVLRDLMNKTRQQKDFIFRTFIENYNKNGQFAGYIPQSLTTGKAESIVTKKGERIETLNRFRNALQGAEGAVVKKIENENSERIFSPVEQALTHLSTAGSLNVDLQVSPKALEFEESLQEILDQELDKELAKIITHKTAKR